jgi:cytochrome c-type biogenesis protein CcmH
MVQRLAQRLQAEPNDAEGWAMLGRSHFVLKRYAESAQAYARANALMQPPDPDLLVSEGGALGLAADGNLSGRPRELFDTALKRSPDHLRALWFAGQAAVQAGDYALAQSHWERLLKQELPDDLRAEVEAHVQELSAQTGRKATIASGAPSEKAGPSLRVKVLLDPAMAAKRKSGQVLYVFAKAAQGPPMPLAVQKLQPDTWPVELTLDDSMAMAPAMRLSQFDRWIVTARLGAEGSPLPQPGDLQGQVVVSRGASPQNVEVVISEQVQ